MGGSTWGLRAAMRCGLGIQGSACPIKYKRPPSPGLHMSLHCPYHMIMSEISSPQPRVSSSPRESTHPISQRPEGVAGSMVPTQLTHEQAGSEPAPDTAGLRVVLGTSTDELRESFFRACHAEWNSSVPWEARHQSWVMRARALMQQAYLQREEAELKQAKWLADGRGQLWWVFRSAPCAPPAITSSPWR